MKSIKYMGIALVAAFGLTACTDSFLDKTRRGKLIRGYGGIEKYYR